MRLATLDVGGRPVLATPLPSAGALLDLDGFHDVMLKRGEVPARAEVGDLRATLSGGQAAMSLISELADRASLANPDELRAEGVLIDEATASFLPVIPNGPAIYCVGRNYLAHVREGGRDVPDSPPIFLRLPGSLTGHRQPIVKPAVSDQLDWEGELAVVIGTNCARVPAADAIAMVAGYTVFNDVSVRDYQHHTAQWTPGKNFWRTGPLGPFLVTRDEISDPMDLALETRVNETVVQSARTQEMIFEVSRLIAYISMWMPLSPGDVIATGTPSGVGNARKPPWYLTEGDVVSVRIEGVGELSNPVVSETQIGLIPAELFAQGGP